MLTEKVLKSVRGGLFEHLKIEYTPGHKSEIRFNLEDCTGVAIVGNYNDIAAAAIRFRDMGGELSSDELKTIDIWEQSVGGDRFA